MIEKNFTFFAFLKVKTFFHFSFYAIYSHDGKTVIFYSFSNYGKIFFFYTILYVSIILFKVVPANQTNYFHFNN